MKIPAEWNLFIASMGKKLRVQHIILADTGQDAQRTANELMARRPSLAVIAARGPMVLLADKHDQGLSHHSNITDEGQSPRRIPMLVTIDGETATTLLETLTSSIEDEHESPRGCGHSRCSQHYIDEGSHACLDKLEPMEEARDKLLAAVREAQSYATKS